MSTPCTNKCECEGVWHSLEKLKLLHFTALFVYLIWFKTAARETVKCPFASRIPSEVRALTAALAHLLLWLVLLLSLCWVKGAIPEDNIRHVPQFLEHSFF